MKSRAVSTVPTPVTWSSRKTLLPLDRVFLRPRRPVKRAVLLLRQDAALVEGAGSDGGEEDIEACVVPELQAEGFADGRLPKGRAEITRLRRERR